MLFTQLPAGSLTENTVHQKDDGLYALSEHALRVTPLQNSDPVPYTGDEFPLWLRDLGRFEAVFIGSIPVSMFFTAIAFDLYRLSKQSTETGSFQTGYIPEIVNTNHVPYSQKEQELLIGIGIAGAAAIAITDMIIHLVRRAKRNR